MSLCITGPSQGLSNRTGLPVTRSWTITCWFWLDSIRPETQVILSMESDADYAALVVDPAGRLSYAWSEGGSSVTAGEVVTARTWCQVAVVVNGINATLYQGAADSTPVAYANTAPFLLPLDALTLFFGHSPLLGPDSWVDGRIAAVKMWNAALQVPAEVDWELGAHLPVRTDNLDRWYPLLSADDPVDYSNNGHHLTGSGASTAEGPPIGWRTSSTDPVIPWDPDTLLWAVVYSTVDGSALFVDLVSNLSLPPPAGQSYKTFSTVLYTPENGYGGRAFYPQGLEWNNLDGPIRIDRFNDLLHDPDLAEVWSSLSSDHISVLHDKIRALLGPSMWWRLDYQPSYIDENSFAPGYSGEPTLPWDQ